MPRSAEDYSSELTQISKSVLVEAARVLGSYRNALVLIGGWAPYFILESYGDPDVDFQHVGSIDIDLAVDPDVLDQTDYATMARLLSDRGYTLSEKEPFRWFRTVDDPITGEPVTTEVDFLCPPPPRGQGWKRRYRELQRGLRAHTLPGCQIAFRHFFPFAVSNVLPGGGLAEVEIKVAGVVSCLALKGLALADRLRPKDAYDIYTVCGYHRGGPSAVASLLRPHLSDPTLSVGLQAIREKFRTLDTEGPFSVADFLARDDPARHDFHRRDAYETVAEVLRLLEML
ncbi:MAG TPA: hypothetical protein DCP08_08805 [Chloroflexi bacterium]|nr:hypothetical protein [Chloroflexota bacterium]